MSDKEVNATIVSVKALTEELAILRIRPDAGVPEFEPGQYGELAFPENVQNGKLVRRAYSIASPKSVREYLEFFIVRVPDGAFTPQLFSRKEGERIWINPKVKGKFTLDEIPPGKNLVMIATGTGLAPFVSMIREYHGKNRWEKLAVIHCVRLASDLGYRDELEALQAADPNVSYLPTVTREPEGSPWTGLRGRVQPIFTDGVFEAFPLQPENTHVLLCGNPEMINGVVSLLSERGFKEHSKKDPGNIHLERYW